MRVGGITRTVSPPLLPAFPLSPLSRKVFFPVLLLSLLIFPLHVMADEQIVVTVLLNGQPKGDIFVILRDDGDFLLKERALKDMGLQRVEGRGEEFSGEPYLSLRSVKGLAYRFDEKSLTLAIEAAPTLLPKNVLDLSPVRNTGVLYPRDTSVFLNYGLSYHATGESLGFSDLNLSNELGARFKDTLFLTNTLFTDKPGGSQFIRLNTSLIRDDRQTMRRLVGGDFAAASGELGSQVNMGGVSFSKVYQIDPYFIHSPMFNFSGLLSQPSDVELYVNGARIRTDRFAPGEFELRNLQALIGAQQVEVVIRDPYGREQHYLNPFYFSDTILREGLHEYSYNVGSLRRNFGQASNDYAHLVFSAFHRYGVSDGFNLGARSEGGDGLINVGVQSTVKLANYGLVRGELAASHRQSASGTAGLISYEYLSPTLQGNLSLQAFSDGYRTLTDTITTGSRRKLNLLAGCGYSVPVLGSLAIQYLKTETYDGAGNSNLSLSWSRQLWRRVFINTSVRRVLEPQAGNEAFVFLTWNFAPTYSATASFRREQQTDFQTVEVRKDPPVGEGIGWSTRAERAENNGRESYTVNPTFQYNAQRSILRGDYTMTEGGGASSKDLLLSFSGSLVYLGSTFALARPVNDSFALVKVGDVEGVRVSANGQVLGRTDAEGKAVIPEMTSFYENLLSMEDKDVPVDYLMPRVRLFLSPPYRSGSCLYFPLQKYLAVTGTIVLAGGEPLANAELTLLTPGGKIAFMTGENGEFFFDNSQAEIDLLRMQGCGVLPEAATAFLPPGTYPVTVRREGQSFTAQMAIPKAAGPTVDLGTVVFTSPLPAPASKPAPGGEAPAGGAPAGTTLPSGVPSPPAMPKQ